MGYDKACRAWTPESVLKSIQGPTSSDQGPQPMEVDRIENKGKGKYKGKNKDKGKSWWNYGGYGSGAFGRVEAKAEAVETKERGKEKRKANPSRMARILARRARTKARWTPSSASFVLNMDIGHVTVQKEWFNKLFKVILLNFHKYQFNLLVKEFSLKPDNLPNRAIPLLQQAQLFAESSISQWECRCCQVLQVLQCEWSTGEKTDNGVVILDSGPNVSLLPLSYGQCGMDAVRAEDVQLRDCQGSHLKVTGYRTVSLVVKDGDGTEAELEHAFLIANVKSCILSLGQLYRNGWCVKQMDDGSGPYLESPDKELHIPLFYQRNSLAMNATVCRVEQVEDEGMMSPHACVRAIVELKNKFRPENLLNNVWQVADGYPYPRCISSNYVDPRPTWAGNFGFRTTLVQKRSTASEDHGWNVVEVSTKYLELDNLFSRPCWVC